MKLSNLRRVEYHEVEEWLAENVELTPYQKSKLHSNEVFIFSPFVFYKKEKRNPSSLWWRLTLPFYPIYILLLLIFCSIKWVFTGKSYLSQIYLEKYHYNWQKKLDL